MNTSIEILAGREMGQLPVSIGTSLALESVTGILPEHETDDPDIHKFDSLWVNVRTLFRNIVASIPSDQKVMLSPEDIVETIKQEMSAIEELVNKITFSKVKVHFYVTTLKSFLRTFSKSIPKYPKTERQKFHAALEKVALDYFIDNFDAFENLRVFDVKVEAKGGKSLIMTHQPIDLLSRYEFKQLILLESHTGALKGPSLWSTKLTGGKNLIRIPFNKLTLQVFGDGEMFSTFPIKIKRELLRIAEEENWTVNTTTEKMRYGINKSYDPKFKELMFELMR